MSSSAGLTRAAVAAVYRRPLLELVFDAAIAHRAHHDPAEVQCATLLSIKTGACAEDCKYCSQSARYETGLEREKLMDVDAVERAARQAQAAGADRFCMGAAWRGPRDGRDFDSVLEMVRRVKALVRHAGALCRGLGEFREIVGHQ